MKCGIISAVTGKQYDPVVKITNPLKEAYCRKWGYDYLYIDYKASPLGRHPYWDMIYFMEKHLDKYDLLMWLDGDAAPTNFTYSMESKAEGDYEGWIGEETNGKERVYLNTGSMIVRNSSWVKWLLGYWGSSKIYEEFRRHGNPEQDALTEIWHRNVNEAKNKIKVEPLRYMNTIGVGCSRKWQPGDWIKHICHAPKDERFRKQFLEGVDKKLIKEVFGAGFSV